MQCKGITFGPRDIWTSVFYTPLTFHGINDLLLNKGSICWNLWCIYFQISHVSVEELDVWSYVCSLIDVLKFSTMAWLNLLLSHFSFFYFLSLYLSVLRPRPGWQQRGPRGQRPERSAWRSWRDNRKRYKSRINSLLFKIMNIRYTLQVTVKDIAVCCMATWHLRLSSKQEHLIQISAIVSHMAWQCVTLSNQRISSVLLLVLCWQFGPKAFPVNTALHS